MYNNAHYKCQSAITSFTLYAIRSFAVAVTVSGYDILSYFLLLCRILVARSHFFIRKNRNQRIRSPKLPYGNCSLNVRANRCRYCISRAANNIDACLASTITPTIRRVFPSLSFFLCRFLNFYSSENSPKPRDDTMSLCVVFAQCD